MTARGSWCQISRELVLAVAFRKLALEWCCWHPQGRTNLCFSSSPVFGWVRHAQGGGRQKLAPVHEPAGGFVFVGWCSRDKAVSRV